MAAPDPRAESASEQVATAPRKVSLKATLRSTEAGIALADRLMAQWVDGDCRARVSGRTDNVVTIFSTREYLPEVLADLRRRGDLGGLAYASASAALTRL